MQSLEREVQREPPVTEAPVEQGLPDPPQTGRKDTSGPMVRPPIAYGCSLLCGFLLSRTWPLELSTPAALMVVGVLLVTVSILLFALSIRELWKLGTPVPSSRPSRAVVQTGPYRLSRNPIYVSFTLLQLGIGLWAGNGWLLVLLVPVLLLISYGVIDREEAYMTERFGDEYLGYRRSVRRWL